MDSYLAKRLIFFLALLLGVGSCSRTCATVNDSLKQKLTPMQYEVTQRDGTEPAFHNEYWDNKQEGIYVDVVSGEPLFSSLHKYDSGTGWPSFYQPLEPDNIVEKEDHRLFAARTEVRSRKGNSHLGHVFKDGPPPTHLRYCLNSAALRFVPKDQLAAQGLGKYLAMFSQALHHEAAAYFAGGCFWCMEADFLKVPGVLDVESGYLGGVEAKPSYEQVSAGLTGHAEAVRVSFDPSQVSYEDLLKVFWLSIDPTVINRQFCDVGKQYRTAIFFTDGQHQEAATKSLLWLRQNYPDIAPKTEISKALSFYRAEDYHQRYAQKNPIRYKYYRFSCGRDRRLDELYGSRRAQLLAPLKLK